MSPNRRSHILPDGSTLPDKKYKSLIPKTRIIVFDSEQNDRALLGLALKSLRPEIEVLEATTALEVAQHVGTGPIAAIVADPGASFAELSTVVDELRRRDPRCQFWLFSGAEDAPPARDCVGRGVDGRASKTSAGYLGLPGRLCDRLRIAGEILDDVKLEVTNVLTEAYALPAGIVDRRGALIVVNRSLEKLLAQPRYELVAQTLDAFLAEHHDRDEIRRRCDGPRVGWELAIAMDLPASGRSTVAAVGRPLGGRTGGADLWLVNLLNLSPLLRSGDELGSSPADNGELDRLLFAIGHDLQAPLNSLHSNAQWLGERLAGADPETESVVRELAALAGRMQQMLDGLLELSTLRAGVREPELVELEEVLDDAMANLKSDIDRAGATIEVQPLPSLVVNRQQILQVFQNLLANALKFRGVRVPRIRVSAQETRESLRILFEDNGIGIDPKDLSRIFGMFQRLHGEREYPGLGIGLALCQQIVRGHGGELLVESTPGRGTCFILEFKGAGLRSVRARSSR